MFHRVVLTAVFFISFLFSFCMGGSSHAEKVELEPLVVTATRVEAPLREVGSSITVITEQELASRQKMPVLEVLRGLPDVDVVQSGGLGRQTSVFIRGANPNHTLVLIDGIEANDPSSPDGAFDFANLLTDNIERIEILRGPQSTLYGSDAIGGVIHIITKKGKGRSSPYLKAEGGSLDTFKIIGGINGGSERGDYSLSASRLETAGISAANEERGNGERDGYRNTTVAARLGLTPWPTLGLNIILRYNNAHADLDEFKCLDIFCATSLLVDDPNSTQDTEQLLVRGQGQLSLFNGLWEQKLGVSYTLHDRKNDNPFDLNTLFSSRSSFDGEKLKGEWQHTLYLHESNTLTFGVETEEERAKTQFIHSIFGIFTLPEKSADTTGYYLQDQLRLWNTFYVTAGVRLDDHSRFGEKITWRVAPALVFDATGTKLKASYGTGFKAPTLSQFFDPFSGNPDLKPEKSRGWDIGMEQSFWQNRLAFGGTYFDNKLTDLIDFGPAPFFKSINIGKAETEGYELFAALTPLSDLTLRADYTRTVTEDERTGLTLLRRPGHKAGFNANLHFLGKGNIDLGITYVGRREEQDFSTSPATRVELPSYTVINLAASYDLNSHLQMFGRIENLLDKDYEEVLGFGAPGITGYGGIRLSY
jgi:vitamin B12 transporter